MKFAKKNFQVVFAVFLLALPIWAVGAPQVSKVEPPNWWANHSINPVRLLVRGENFQNSKVNSLDKTSESFKCARQFARRLFVF